LVEELGGKRVHIWDGQNRTNYKSPALVLENLTAVKRMRDYLDRIVKDKSNKKYYDRVV
jgi:hypothetical protein